MKANKYGAKKTLYDGVLYDSKAEAAYAAHLDHQLEVGEIFGWDRQVRYPLAVNGVKICTYVLDFRIHHGDGTCQHVDVKGQRSGAAWSAFRLKQKLMFACHAIAVEVYPPQKPAHSRGSI